MRSGARSESVGLIAVEDVCLLHNKLWVLIFKFVCIGLEARVGGLETLGGFPPCWIAFGTSFISLG